MNKHQASLICKAGFGDPELTTQAACSCCSLQRQGWGWVSHPAHSWAISAVLSSLLLSSHHHGCVTSSVPQGWQGGDWCCIGCPAALGSTGCPAAPQHLASQPRWEWTRANASNRAKAREETVWNWSELVGHLSNGMARMAMALRWITPDHKSTWKHKGEEQPKGEGRLFTEGKAKAAIQKILAYEYPSKLKKENAVQGAEGPQHRYKLSWVIAHLVKLLGNPASSSRYQTLGDRL